MLALEINIHIRMEKIVSIKSQTFWSWMSFLLNIIICFASISHILLYNFCFISFVLKEKIMEIKKQLGEMDNKFVQVIVKWLYY